jgi:tetratricopeptide (TPR) repeat protein
VVAWLVFLIFSLTSASPCLCGQQSKRPSKAQAQTEQAAIEAARQQAITAFEEGQRAHAQGKLEQAIQQYSAALGIIPDFPEALYQRGMAYLALSKFDQAEKDLSQVVALEADILSSSEQAQPPLRSFFARVHSALGDIFSQRSDSAKAEEHYRRAVQLDVQLQRARTSLASILIAKDAFQEAIEQLQAALGAGAVSASVYSLLGFAYEKVGQPAVALENYTKAIELDPKDRTARERRSQLLADRREYQAAIDDLMVVYKQDNSSAVALRLAELYEKAEKLSEAIDLYQQTLQQPSSAAEAKQIRFKLVDLFLSTNRQEEALAQAQQLVNENPNDATVIARLGSLLLSVDPAKAARAYDRALELDPHHVPYQIALGTALIKMQRYQEALPPLLDALQRAPGDYYAHSNLATAYFQLKDFAQAAEHFQWIVDLRPETAIAYYFLGICRDKLMEYDLALKAYERFLELADAKQQQAEIDNVKYRLPSLRRQIEKGKGQRKKTQDSRPKTQDSRVRIGFILDPRSSIFNPQSAIRVSQEDIQTLLTADEWKVVNRHGNQVKRVRELLKVAANRLERARQLTTREAFTEATKLVEDYTAIISYTLTFIDNIPDKDRKRRRSAYKEFDLAVRKQIQSLEDLRHSWPVGNTVAEEAVTTAQRLRIMALNGFSGAEIFRVPEKRP